MIETLRKIRSQKGFTLLELLVVVAIIAILATLILANLNRARKQAQDAKVQSEVKAISDAVQLYLTSNPDGGTLPLTGSVPTGNPPVGGSGVEVTQGLFSSSLLASPDPLLRSVPQHPSQTTAASSSTRYHFAGSNATGSYTYMVSGFQPAANSCFEIIDGSVVSPAPTTCP